MQIEKQIWNERMDNLLSRRAKGTKDNQHCENAVSDYASHLKKIYLGKTILDIGCGDQIIKRLLPQDKIYTGIDAFPCTQTAIKMEIESCNFKDKSFDTLLCFAALDGLYDLKAASKNMKRISRENIVFLTGVNIPPDQYHTFEITENLLDELMQGLNLRTKIFLTEKVMLIEYAHPEFKL